MKIGIGDRMDQDWLRYVGCIRWLPLLWMSVTIFGLSADSHSGELSQKLLLGLFGPTILEPQWLAPAQYLIRKAAHFSEFGAFFWSAVVALGSQRWRQAWALGVGFAALDEIHQLLVPGRVPAITDVLIDSCGVTAAAIVWMACWGPPARPAGTER